MTRNKQTVLTRLALEVNTWHDTQYTHWHTGCLYGDDVLLDDIECEIATILKSHGKEGLQPSDIEKAIIDKEKPTMDATFTREWANGFLSTSVEIDVDGNVNGLQIEHFAGKGENHVEDSVKFNKFPYKAICDGAKFLNDKERDRALSAFFKVPDAKLKNLKQCIQQFENVEPGSQQALEKRESALSNAFDLIGQNEGFVLKTIQSYNGGYVELVCADGCFGERFAKCLSNVKIKFDHHTWGFDKQNFRNDHTWALVCEQDLIKLVKSYAIQNL